MAVVVHRVPARLDAAHLGFVVIHEMGNGHCGAPVRWIIGQAGLATHTGIDCVVLGLSDESTTRADVRNADAIGTCEKQT